MGKRLVITEKPSVAKDIVSALGGFDIVQAGRRPGSGLLGK